VPPRDVTEGQIQAAYDAAEKDDSFDQSKRDTYRDAAVAVCQSYSDDEDEDGDVTFEIAGVPSTGSDAQASASNSEESESKNVQVPSSQATPSQSVPSQTAPSQGDASQTAPSQAQAVPVRSSIDDYSWAELSNIASQIARAGSDAEGLRTAEKYNLCNSDGTLDGAGQKSFSLTDGTPARVQIVGFRHDDRPDGSGRAGITFAFTTPVGVRAMSDSRMTSGGWEQCQMRAYLNGGFVGLLPSDLAARLTPVAKLTNNVGATREASSITTTVDAVWLPSMTEMGGDYAASRFNSRYTYLSGIYSGEGEQYQLWREEGIGPMTGNSALRKTWLGSDCYWWTRTPSPDCSESHGQTWFNRVGPDGDVFHYACPATGDGNTIVVLPAFCL
jgi:hypothetical protein